jgi:hypothetical protein
VGPAVTVKEPGALISTVPTSARLQLLPVSSEAPMPRKPGPLISIAWPSAGVTLTSRLSGTPKSIVSAVPLAL